MYMNVTAASADLLWEWKNLISGLCAQEGYKGCDDEDGAEDVILEGEKSQAHVGKDEILSQEVKGFKKLQLKN